MYSNMELFEVFLLIIIALSCLTDSYFLLKEKLKPRKKRRKRRRNKKVVIKSLRAVEEEAL